MTNLYFLDRVMGTDWNIRAADADRERVAERLRTCHAEGRLDMAEFQERLERCYAAKTLGELRELTRDLPIEQQQRQQAAPRSFLRFLSPRLRLVPLVPVLIAVIIVAAAVSGHHSFWLWIPFVFIIWRMSWWRRRRWYSGPRRGPGNWI